MPKRRAISDSDKASRRESILDAGLALFSEGAFEALSMTQVADRAGLAKGTLYLYFKTKEELFLALLVRELEGWFDATGAALVADRPIAPDGFIELLADSLVERPQLLRLLAILHTVLERNIDYDKARDFKLWLAQRSQLTGELLERRLAFLGPGEGLRLLLRIHALIIGLQHMAEPSPVVREVLAAPELAAFRVDFRDEFLTTLSALLRGFTQRSDHHA